MFDKSRFNDKVLLDILTSSSEATAIYTTDEIVVQYANDAMLAFWGKDSTIMGLPLEVAVPELKGQPFKQLLQQVLRTGITNKGILPAETLIEGKLQTHFYEYEYRPLFDQKKDVFCIFHTAVDVTERERNKVVIVQQQEDSQALSEELAASNEELRVTNEELTLSNRELDTAQQQLQNAYSQLEESEIALRLAIEAANFGTWHIHSVTREFITSPRLRELFGYHHEENISIEDALRQITDEYREFVSAALENAIYEGGDYDVTYPVVGYHDKVLRWLRAIGNLKSDPSGTFSAFTGVVMDVSEQKKDEQRKSDFIGMVSHELKTPLTSLSAFVQMLHAKAKASGDTFSAGALHQANKQAKKMKTMINGFLNVSRLESGQINLDMQRFDIEELISEVEEEISFTSNATSITFHPCKPVYVMADRDKIAQVISNLLSNALKYSPKDKPIEVECHELDGFIKLTVKDQGIGIAPHAIERLFQRYYRVQGVNPTISGFGIGLYLCFEIIQRHNGEIGVESKEGEGSTFWFTLPLS
jgi:two-component system sensor histidine kinase VicK